MPCTNCYRCETTSFKKNKLLLRCCTYCMYQNKQITKNPSYFSHNAIMIIRAIGTLGLKLSYGTNEKDHLAGCVSLIKQTVTDLFNGTLTQISDTPNSCKSTSSFWQAGNAILKSVSSYLEIK